MISRGVLDRIRCWRVQRVLQLYLDGQADRTIEARVARHLEACRRCCRESRVYAAISSALARNGERDVNEAAVARLRTLAARFTDTGTTETASADTGTGDTDTGERS